MAYFSTNSKPTEGRWDSAGKQIFGDEKLSFEMKNKLKSGLENKHFAKRPSCKRIRSGTVNTIRVLSPLLHTLCSSLRSYVFIDVRSKETETSGWAQHKKKGKQDTIFLLVHSDMTVWSKKNNNQSLWESCFPDTFSNSIATSVRQIFINTRVVSVL